MSQQAQRQQQGCAHCFRLLQRQKLFKLSSLPTGSPSRFATLQASCYVVSAYTWVRSFETEVDRVQSSERLSLRRPRCRISRTEGSPLIDQDAKRLSRPGAQLRHLSKRFPQNCKTLDVTQGSKFALNVKYQSCATRQTSRSKQRYRYAIRQEANFAASSIKKALHAHQYLAHCSLSKQQ